ncbi:MAG: MBL fold metallo-hydrolase [Bosea sp. (in: a-proteobacteria)]|uniref:MBL fold metallo-hydrolase n=1 Tax=Bosea sp. (in: a-proteobacteria) TaxID=1871050 RepID=UPI000B1FF785|nr:MBL fold metallo-hydrolase [Bosea sp. (in: a-proteobacteria)]MDP3600766.1 MBL fold metallo-hydrolase [Bosea sp. (in: a-proteobacteria)]
MLDRRCMLAAGAALLLPTGRFPASAQVVARIGADAAGVTVLSDGGFEMPAAMLARDIDIAQVRDAAKVEGPLTTVLNVTCLKRGQDTIVFDCGSGANFLPGTGKLAASLEAAGIAPDSVTHVLFTHLHPDHLWGALDDFDTPLFPNARWLAGAEEVGYWTNPKVYEGLPEDRHAFAAGAQRVLKELGDRLETRTPGQDWAPGVTAFSTAGHTPGHVSFAFNDALGPVYVVGDALTHPVISFAHPDWRPASDHDPDRAVATRRALLERAVAEKARIIGYHLPGAIGRVEKQGAAYRFVQPA